MDTLSGRRRFAIALFAIEALVVVLFVALNVVPILWGVLTSLKSPRDIAAFPPKVFNFTPVLEHYIRVIEGGFFMSFLVSVGNSFATVLGGILLASTTAFGFDRYKFRLRKALFFCVVLGIPLSIGSSALLIPNFLYMSRLGLNNRLVTLPLLYITYNLPMAIWIMKGNIEAIPISIDESARIEGCSDMYIFFRMIIPLAKPALAASSLFLFIGSWNEFITSSVMVDSPHLRPVQLAIYNYLGYYGREWGPLTASATIAIIPIILVFAVLSRLLISGLTQGAVKG